MRRTLLIAVSVGACALALVVVEAQQRGDTSSGRTMTLTPIDYIEIRQLAARYGHAVDQGADNGYAYADLFAADGTFGQTRGRDELAKLAKQTARGPQTAWHFIVNHVIEPTEDGAKGQEYLVHLRYGEPEQPNIVWGGGHYEDTYVKTPNGWRFKTRRFIRSEGTPESLKPQAASR
jgi:SnoaL-like domain